MKSEITVRQFTDAFIIESAVVLGPLRTSLVKSQKHVFEGVCEMTRLIGERLEIVLSDRAECDRTGHTEWDISAAHILAALVDQERQGSAP